MSQRNQISPVLSLQDVSNNFTHWRKTRTKRGKIPDELMNQAFSLVGHYKQTHISKTLGFRHANFKSQCINRGLVKPKNQTKSNTVPATFVELKTTTMTQPDIKLSVTRTDGVSMQINVNDYRTAQTFMDHFLS